MLKKHPSLIKLIEKIRELRKDKGFSQEAFADEIDLDRTYMGGIERGERNIATLNLIRIALGIKVGEQFPSINKLKKLINL
jgi:transcriptional regulator with XRE-family HTH domain